MIGNIVSHFAARLGDVIYSPLAALPVVWLVVILIPVIALITALVVWIVKRIKRNKRGRDE